MKKRNIIIVALCALIISLVLGVLALLPPRPGVTKANFDRIEKGMTVAQVDELFGPLSADVVRQEQEYGVTWEISDELIVVVEHDRSLRIVEAHWVDLDASFSRRLLRMVFPL